MRSYSTPKTHAPGKLKARPLCGRRPKLGFRLLFSEDQTEVTCSICAAKLRKVRYLGEWEAK